MRKSSGRLIGTVLLVTMFLSGTIELSAHTDPNIYLTQQEREYLQSHPTIKVQNEKNWPPFNFNEDGVAKGFCIDYINLVAQKLDIRVEHISGYSWSEFVEMLQTPQLDLMTNIVKDEKREDIFSFTDITLSLKPAIYTNIQNQNINSLEDLKNKTIAMQEGFFTQKFIQENYPSIKQVLVKDSLEALSLLSLGRVDAIIGTKAVLDYLIQNNAISNVLATQYIEDERVTTHLRLASAKSDRILIDIVQKAQNVVTPQEMQALKSKWFVAKMKNQLNPIDLSPREKAYLREKKEVKMCIDPDWMPFESYKNGQYRGLSADYFKIFQEKLGIPISVVPSKNWTESLEYAKERRCDILSLIMKTPKREEYMNFTTPYSTAPLVLTTKLDVPFMTDFYTLTNQKLGIPKGFGYIETLKIKYPNLTIVEVANIRDGLERVSKGELFGYIDALPSIGYISQKEFLGDIKIAGKFDDDLDLRIAVRDDDGMLLNIFQKIIDSTSEATHQKILNRWTAIKYEKRVDYALILNIVLGFIGFILVGALFLIILRKKNRKLEMIKDEVQVLNHTLEQRVKQEVAKNKQQHILMMHQSRLAQMGEMISMIAHQWRQPLNNLDMLNQTIYMASKNDTLDSEFLDYFQKTSDREIANMSNTIDTFRDFFKPDKELVVFDLGEVIIDSIDLVALIFDRANISIELKLVEGPSCEGFPNELGQSIINILNNAKDAFVDNKIEVDKKIEIRTYTKNSDIIIEIQDNAGGVSPEIIDKIFDPYFSTKLAKSGTGLGLYLTKMIIEENMKGAIDVTNVEGGAMFTIVLQKV